MLECTIDFTMLRSEEVQDDDFSGGYYGYDESHTRSRFMDLIEIDYSSCKRQ